MEKAWRDDQLVRINNGTSIFSYIPPQIGSIVYCDSSTDKSSRGPAYTRGQKVMTIIGFLMIINVIIAIWMGDRLLAGCLVWMTVCLLILGLKRQKFRGSDYFVGEKGFAKVSFEGDRRSIVSVQIALFDDMPNLCISEEEVWPGLFDCSVAIRGRRYMHTAHYCNAYRIDAQSAKSTLLACFEGRFKDRGKHFCESPNEPDAEFEFLRLIENTLTSRFLHKHAYDQAIYFPSIDKHGNCYQCVTVYPQSISVTDKRGKQYNFLFNEIKNVRLNGDNTLTIKSINNNGKENVATIDYSCLANGKALLTLLLDRTGKVSYPTPYSVPENDCHYSSSDIYCHVTNSDADRNPFAILGFVFSLVSIMPAIASLYAFLLFSPLGVVFSILGLRRPAKKVFAIIGLCVCLLNAIISLLITIL